MATDVQIKSRETIQPSSPTPNHLRTYKLSLLDQLSPPFYVNVVLFYENSVKDINNRIHDQLKASLSKTLTHFYPLAGRLSDAFSIDCNDQGVAYVEARVSYDMSEVLNNPEAPILQQLIPCHPLDDSPDPPGHQLILSVQVNSFACGGIAIGVCVWHLVADAAALASFVAHWAAIARNDANLGNDCIVFDCSSLFPPRDPSGFSYGNVIMDKDQFQTKVVTKRLVFDGSKIASLREKTRNVSGRATRFEALAGLLWSAIVTIIREKHPPIDSSKPHIAFSAINLRTRMDPPLPQECLGSAIQFTAAYWPMDMAVDYKELVGKLGESIRVMNDANFIRELHSKDAYWNFFKDDFGKLAQDPTGAVVFFSSWCKFPFYETDFGWGKPAWMGTVMGVKNLAFFIDAKDGKGIEAWVTLSKEDMAEFEQNPDILECSSLSPTPTIKD